MIKNQISILSNSRKYKNLPKDDSSTNHATLSILSYHKTARYLLNHSKFNLLDRCILEQNLNSSLLNIIEALNNKDMPTLASNLSHGLLSLRTETQGTPIDFVQQKINATPDKKIPIYNDFPKRNNNRWNNNKRWNNNNSWNNNYNNNWNNNNYRGNNRRGRGGRQNY